MPAPSSFATDSRRAGARHVWAGLAAIALLLAGAAVLLVATLPDGDAFNARVERIFVENDDLTGQAEVKLLEILARSGTAFSETLAGYRVVILVLLVFSAAMLLAAVVFLILLLALNRRMAQIERAGIQVNSLILSREENTAYLNNIALKLTDSAMETLTALAEARLDDEMLSGAELEALVTGRPLPDCDEAAGATRIKRLRDGLGNQLVAELLVRNIARRGYILAIDREAIRIL
jgi:DNA-binding winged helix-turn-helix (wHTH) protein